MLLYCNIGVLPACPLSFPQQRSCSRHLRLVSAGFAGVAKAAVMLLLQSFGSRVRRSSRWGCRCRHLMTAAQPTCHAAR
jgi:hypothetical protein